MPLIFLIDEALSLKSEEICDVRHKFFKKKPSGATWPALQACQGGKTGGLEKTPQHCCCRVF
jgi:hypothetical protein